MGDFYVLRFLPTLRFLQSQIMCKLYKCLCEACTKKCQRLQSVEVGRYMEKEEEAERVS